MKNVYIILWQQGHKMLPVCEVGEDGVSYTRVFKSRLLMTAGEANAACSKIFEIYGALANLEIVEDADGKWEPEIERDKFLPAWLWLQKHGNR